MGHQPPFLLAAESLTGDPYLESLIRRADEDGPVLELEDGTVGIFDPDLAQQVEVANAEGLKLPGSLSSLARKGDSPDEMTWREARALLIQRSRQLSAPAHLEALHGRMRAVLEGQGGGPTDFTALTVRCFSRSLLPLIVDGLPKTSSKRVAAYQELNITRLFAPPGGRSGFVRRIAERLGEVAAGRAISNHLQRRFEGLEPPRDDYAEAIVPLVGRVGVARSTYLLTTLLTAVATPPGLVAACVLYELVRHPEWRERVREELGGLGAGGLYSAGRRTPVTTRFIKEAMRLWAFPLVTHRIAYRELEVAGTKIGLRCPYDLSPFVMHHSERHWRDPERFDPDRWLATGELPSPATYVPFGFGPRSCVGASVGLAQLLLFCQLAACEFEFEIEPGRRPRMTLHGFAIPADLAGTLRPSR